MIGSLVLSVGRFALHFLEMLLAMYAGMLIFMAIPGVVALPALLHQFGMALSMTLPMVLWMRIRGHGWRHGFEMSAAMLVPWAVARRQAAERALFVIDPFGTIAWSAVFPDAVDPGLDAILTALEALYGLPRMKGHPA
jgi:hypothetical protein